MEATRGGSRKLTTKVVNGLTAYADRTFLQKAVLMNVASHLSVATVPELARVFEEYDRDSCGTLDKNDLTQALCAVGIPQERAEATADSLDMDGNGRVYYTEFVAGCIGQFGNRLDHTLWDLFARHDGDSDGFLEISELTASRFDRATGCGC